MTADRLARHYSALRPDERLALMLAAVARGDEVEHERLTAAAPRSTFTTLHTFPRAIAFREILDRFRAERLDLAARYYHARFAAIWPGVVRPNGWSAWRTLTVPSSSPAGSGGRGSVPAAGRAEPPFW